jgi:hypothetical protein
MIFSRAIVPTVSVGKHPRMLRVPSWDTRIASLYI